MKVHPVFGGVLESFLLVALLVADGFGHGDILFEGRVLQVGVGASVKFFEALCASFLLPIANERFWFVGVLVHFLL